MQIISGDSFAYLKTLACRRAERQVIFVCVCGVFLFFSNSSLHIVGRAGGEKDAGINQ